MAMRDQPPEAGAADVAGAAREQNLHRIGFLGPPVERPGSPAGPAGEP